MHCISKFCGAIIIELHCISCVSDGDVWGRLLGTEDLDTGRTLQTSSGHSDGTLFGSRYMLGGEEEAITMQRVASAPEGYRVRPSLPWRSPCPGWHLLHLQCTHNAAGDSLMSKTVCAAMRKAVTERQGEGSVEA